mmetsp:Transcript_5341/g.10252  ORF Transcript_5341/g.10252 Transcript_5341/m.10252 type:complete len:102 (-) Transcript_5341:690-995(-)
MRLIAMATSTEGPSGPREHPVPRVKMDANALRTNPNAYKGSNRSIFFLPGIIIAGVARSIQAFVMKLVEEGQGCVVNLVYLPSHSGREGTKRSQDGHGDST